MVNSGRVLNSSEPRDAVSAFGEEFGAVGEGHLFHTKDLQAVFRAMAFQYDLVSRLERGSFPAGRARQDTWAIHLGLPILEAPVVRFYIERDFDVGIDELEIRDGAFDCDELRGVVASFAAVSKRWHG